MSARTIVGVDLTEDQVEAAYQGLMIALGHVQQQMAIENVIYDKDRIGRLSNLESDMQEACNILSGARP